MDEDGIGLVLARASELRAKITNRIHNSSTEHVDRNVPREESGRIQKDPLSDSGVEFGEAYEEQETESLLDIRDALESLEVQLSSLQALQQQQWYEREAALAEIDHSRKKLLKNLKEYQGEELEIIQETTAFASETVEERNDLLLPPYPARPRLFISNNGYLPSQFHSKHKASQDSLANGDPASETNKNLNVIERNPSHSESKNSVKLVGGILCAATKIAITLGVISVLKLAGFNPRFRETDSQLKLLSLFQQGGRREENTESILCPPGKVAVVENGESRCIVKERIEIPFESFVGTPDVSYGCG